MLGLVDTVRLGVVRFGSDLGRGDNPNEFYSSVRSSDTRHPEQYVNGAHLASEISASGLEHCWGQRRLLAPVLDSPLPP